MNRRPLLRFKVGLIAASLLLAPGLTAAGAMQPPRLIPQITVDALRGDLPGRYAYLYGGGGSQVGDSPGVAMWSGREGIK